MRHFHQYELAVELKDESVQFVFSPNTFAVLMLHLPCSRRIIFTCLGHIELLLEILLVFAVFDCLKAYIYDLKALQSIKNSVTLGLCEEESGPGGLYHNSHVSTIFEFSLIVLFVFVKF